MNLATISEKLTARASSLGFDLCGFTAVDALSGDSHFAEWIERGYAGEMRYLAARNESGLLKRAAIKNAVPWAHSAIVCAISYNSAAEPLSTNCRQPDRGWISRYAWAETDYHDLLLPKLRALESTLASEASACGAGAVRSWCYVDTGPVREKALAESARLGWIGKNTCLIHPKLGSWLFLGVILCSLEFTSDKHNVDEPAAVFSATDLPATNLCGSCTRCLDACPTQALVTPGVLDARRCIAYLTVELKGEIPELLREDVGHNIYGCDICQDVCPWNRRAQPSRAPEMAARTEVVNPQLAWISGMNNTAFLAHFRHSALRRRKLKGLLRSAAIAMGNSGNKDFLPQLEAMASQAEDSVLARHAHWALEKLCNQPEKSGKAGGI